jgi:hypothetical protein
VKVSQRADAVDGRETSEAFEKPSRPPCGVAVAFSIPRLLVAVHPFIEEVVQKPGAPVGLDPEAPARQKSRQHQILADVGV